MSGRWVEMSAPWTSILVLDDAIRDTSGIEWEVRPQVLSEIEQLRTNASDISDRLGKLISSIDEEGIDLNSYMDALEGSDQELDAALNDLREVSSRVSREFAQLKELSSQLNNLNLELRTKIEKCNLTSPDLIQLQGQGRRFDLRKTNGRYTQRIRIEDYEIDPSSAWLPELNRNYEHYNKKASTRIESPRSNDLQARLEARLNQLTDASVLAANENLRRERDRQIMALAKEKGYQITRKTKGKKIEYVLTHYKS